MIKRDVIMKWLQLVEYPVGSTDRDMSKLTVKYIIELEQSNKKLIDLIKNLGAEMLKEETR